jgi:hypothetical protein
LALRLRFIFFTVLSNFCLLTPFFTPLAISCGGKYSILKELQIILYAFKGIREDVVRAKAKESGAGVQERSTIPSPLLLE